MAASLRSGLGCGMAARLVWAAAAAVACAAWAGPVGAMDPADVPSGPPQDAIMAAPGELAETARWASEAFGGLDLPAEPPPPIELKVLRQDHSILRINESCIDTPLRIGEKAYARGLGTHAHSEIQVSVPPGAKAFRAEAGVDNNYDTGGQRGTVQFAVEAGGKVLARTGRLRGGQAAAQIHADLPADARQIVLKVDEAGDGQSHDQADWADARFLLADGTEIFLDQGQHDPLLGGPAPPFSFVYGGKSSAELLRAWPRQAKTADFPDRRDAEVVWSDPATGLRVLARVRVWKRFPAVDWVLHFENAGTQDTPLLENVQAMDVQVRTRYPRQPVVFHSIRGDDCSERSFQPFAEPVRADKPLRLAPVGGRSSNGTFPFYTLAYGQRGLVAAIGWSGQWAASLERQPAGPTRLTAGMEKMRLRLHAGESIRSPRILLMNWRGERRAGQNRFRRLMLFHYVPQIEGRPVAMPVFWQNYDRYNARADWACQAGQVQAADVARRAGCDFLWLDAAWFPGNFPNGVGNWSPKPDAFPDGLKPVSDACRKAGLKFIVWFEPERVAPGSQIAREHPEFVFGGAKGGLFKLSDPRARQWMTDLLSRRIREFGMDWYRNDFNMDPLPSWRAADEGDRAGMTEIRYVEGHYQMWDELRRRHPGLVIDNCASGGRRVDLETCMRSVPLWRSDTACMPGKHEWNQLQACGYGQYIPLSQTCGWTPAAYEFRATAGAGAIAQFAYLEEGFSIEAARAAIDEARANQKYWYGDLYPLTGVNADAGHFMAWQLHRGDLDAGIVLAFRRDECENAGILAGLGGIDPAAEYEVEYLDEDRVRTSAVLSGKVLACELVLKIPRKHASLLVRYRKRSK